MTPVAAEDVATLHGQLLEAMEVGDWQRARVAARGIVEIAPGDPIAHYNLACVLSLDGDRDAAVAALADAGRHGFSAVDSLETDPHLDGVRDHPGFAAAAALVEENRAREFAAFRERADRSEPLLFPPPKAKRGGPESGHPLVVLLHGRGGSADGMARFWKKSARKAGAVLVVPEAFQPYAKGFQWARTDHALYRVERAIEFAAERFPIDRDRMIVAGFSQGARVALVSVAHTPERFAGAIAIGACRPEGFGLGDPSSEASLETGFPIYVGVGSEERTYPNCQPMAERYEAAGSAVKLRVYQGYGHTFPRNYEWEFDRALKFVLASAPRERSP